MQALKSPKAPKIPPLTAEQLLKAADVLRSREVTFWAKKLKISEARERVSMECGFPIRPRCFGKLRNEVCRWFKVVRRGRRSTVTTLDNDGWNDLRSAVRKVAPELQGRTLTEAVAIVCTVCPCNAPLLNGLTAEFHVWKEK